MDKYKGAILCGNRVVPLAQHHFSFSKLLCNTLNLNKIRKSRCLCYYIDTSLKAIHNDTEKRFRLTEDVYAIT